MLTGTTSLCILVNCMIFFYGGLTENSGKASACYKCGQCEGVCPQHLPIIEYLEEAAEKLEKSF